MRSVHAQASERLAPIGAKIRSARGARHMTLEQLAVATGLSRSFISRVENDATSPSVATLVQICQVLSLPIGDLFSEPETHVTPFDAAPHINMGGTGVVERLLTRRSESRAQVIHTTAEPHANGGQELYTVSSNLEVLHVVRGSITVSFSSHDVELARGDTLSFPGNEPHNWHAHDEGAELLWTLIPAAWSGSA